MHHFGKQVLYGLFISIERGAHLKLIMCGWKTKWSQSSILNNNYVYHTLDYILALLYTLPTILKLWIIGIQLVYTIAIGGTLKRAFEVLISVS